MQHGENAVPNDLLAESVELCNLAINLFTDYQQRIDLPLYVPGSPAAVAGDAASRESGPSQSWSDELVKELTHRSLSYLAINTQHIAAIRSLISDDILGLPVGSPVRSMIETSARVAWLLHKDLEPSSDIRRRVARYFLDVDEDLARFASIAHGFGHPEKRKIQKAAKKTHDRIKKPTYFAPEEICKVDTKSRIKTAIEQDSELASLFPAESRRGLTERLAQIAADASDAPLESKRFLAGEDMPTPVRFVKEASAMFHPGRPGVDATYSYLSGMGHPSIYAFQESLDLENPVDDEGYVGVHRDGVFTAKLVALGLQSFCDAWRLYASWTDTGLEEVRVLIDALNSMHGKIPEDDDKD